TRQGARCAPQRQKTVVRFPVPSAPTLTARILLGRIAPLQRGNTMPFLRRQFLRLAAGAAALPAVSRIATAQTYPARPIRVVVPFPPGGAYDTIGRPWAERMKPLLGTVVVENIGGGGGSVGA